MDLSTLNEMQRKAVEYNEGPLLILAGAGSGKTRVLTHKIAYLIEEKRIFPSKILAFTFTNKAAEEMKNRVESLIGGESQGMWMGTFHSICVRILRGDADKIGFNRDYVIYDTTDQKTLLKECMKELEIDDKQLPLKRIQAKISEAKNDMIGPEKFTELYYSDVRMRDICNVYSKYQARLKKNNAMDFDDLILNTIELFEMDEEVLDYYSNKFKYILVDEYQDTNKSQYKLIRFMAKQHGNVCVVGDSDQSIYGWRGADIRNIMDFEKDYKNAQVIKLEQNYRSTQTILDAANDVIKLNLNRKEKRLWTDNACGDKIRYFKASNEYQEAQFAVDQISRMHNQGRPFSDFAVLYRTNAQSRVFEDMLIRENIPYKIVGGLKFYERKEIKDIMSYLKLIQNGLDDIAFLRVINAPKRGIGKKTLETLGDFAISNNISLYQAAIFASEGSMFGKKITSGLKSFVDLIGKYQAVTDEWRISEIFSAMLEDVGYIHNLRLENTIEAQSRIENIQELMSVIVEFEEKYEDNSLRNFLNEMTLRSDIDGLNEEMPGIVMMTLHSAKGLEFPVVFLVGLEEGIFPTGRSLDDPESMEEERRLCYVGITRAEEILYISHAGMRTQYGKTNVNMISRFVEDIDRDLIDSFNGEVDTRVKEPIVFQNNKAFLKDKQVRVNKTEKAFSGDSKELAPGTKINHDKFGMGTVISVNDNGTDAIATIVFDTQGIKKLNVSIAPIKIIN